MHSWPIYPSGNLEKPFTCMTGTDDTMAHPKVCVPNRSLSDLGNLL